MKQFFIFLVLLLLVDTVFLTLFSGYFNRQIMLVQGSPIQIKWLGVILCYILLAFVLTYIVEAKQFTYREAFLLGVIIYGVYETTSYALLKKWSLTTVAIDTLWGGVLFVSVLYLYRKMMKN